MSDKISPLAPKELPDMGEIAGVRLGAIEAGIKYLNRKDLCVILFDQPAQVAGVFTRSLCPSAPVDWCRKMLAGGKASCVVINSGNANAFTGKKGEAAVQATAALAASAFNVDETKVFLASTGVIGEPLDASKFDGKLEEVGKIARADRWEDAAKAIMTTDTFHKMATREIEAGGIKGRINGIAKGAGMIAPDMATMLSFIVTDIPVPHSQLQECLSQGVLGSFNSITVDSDTSTSDTVLAFSVSGSGGGGGSGETDPKPLNEADLKAFSQALNDVLLELALMVVRDGEGASHLVEINVRGAQSDASAHKIALSIANSPLVKTAIAGADANWGRIVMAVGKAGEPADRDKLAIYFGGIRVAHEGERDPDYDEDEVSSVMKKDEIQIDVEMGIKDGKARVWTCDLTKEYVAINGDYRS